MTWYQTVAGVILFALFGALFIVGMSGLLAWTIITVSGWLGI